MAILVSPGNNTGWGLGLKSMYGGARLQSDAHPVRVMEHYRARWGSKKGRVPRGRVRKRRTTSQELDAVIDSVIAEARRDYDRKTRRRRRPGATRRRRRNVYLVKNAAGQRVRVTKRP